MDLRIGLAPQSIRMSPLSSRVEVTAVTEALRHMRRCFKSHNHLLEGRPMLIDGKHDKKTVRFGTEETFLPIGSHVCFLYRTATERDSIAVPFVAQGLYDGASCKYVVDDQTADHLRMELATTGINVTALEDAGQLQILTAAETYLRNAPFNYHEMLTFWEAVGAEVRDSNLPYSRCAGETAFLQQKAPGLEHFLEYEAQLNNYVPKLPLVVLCLYNITKMTGDLVAGVLQTHPYVVMGGVLIHNPYYIPPDKFLSQTGRA